MGLARSPGVTWRLSLALGAVLVAHNGAPGLMNSAAKWTPIFNGRDLTGWEHVGPGRFVVEDGMLKTEGGMGLLWYAPRKLGHCRLRVVYRTGEQGGNSGVFIRIPEKPADPWMPVNRGYEVQIDGSGDEYHRTGVLYSLTRAMARGERLGEWNELEIGLDGARTWVKLNGELITDYTEGAPTPPKRETWEPDRGPRPVEGYIGLQNHSSDDTVYFKEVSTCPSIPAITPPGGTSAPCDPGAVPDRSRHSADPQPRSAPPGR